MDALSAGDLDLERRLESFALARLSPSRVATARIRARVMRETRLELEVGRSLALAAVTPPRRPAIRRFAMPVLAAGLWLAIGVGTMFAAQPGGPLYPTRVWIELAILPSTPADRTTAEIANLESRLAEVMEAVASGDRAAVVAALAAYRQIAEAAMNDAAGDAVLEAKVRSALDSHLDVLAAVAEQVAAKGNDQATSAIQANLIRAIQHNDAVIETLDAAGPPDGAGGPPDDAPPAAAPGSDPDPTKKPASTPKPKPTEEPAAATPRPAPEQPVTPDHRPDTAPSGQGDR